MSVRRSASVLAGAVLLAALAIPGSSASPVAAPTKAPVPARAAAVVPAAGAPAALPSAARPTMAIGAVGAYIASGAVFRIDVTYSCAAKSNGSVTAEAHQNLGDGFAANGFGYTRRPLTCDGKKHTVRLTMSPTGERGFTTGPAYVLADLAACPTNAEVCDPVSMERTLTVR